MTAVLSYWQGTKCKCLEAIPKFVKRFKRPLSRIGSVKLT
jgi:hypothetical protein